VFTRVSSTSRIVACTYAEEGSPSLDADSSDIDAFRVSVVLCTLNGAARLDRCLAAVRRQSLGRRLQLIVVDDGSSDNSAEVAATYGAQVVRHPVNRGPGPARNTGIAVAQAPIIAILDDDCEPEPEWAERLLSGFREGVVGVGGPALPEPGHGYFDGYLERNNPLQPLEIDLASSTRVVYRFGRYLLRNARSRPSGPRVVHAFATANGAFRAEVLQKLGGFDENFRGGEGGEDLDLCLRIGDEYGPGALRFEPSAVLRHHFDTDPRALLRRCRSYGTGAGRLYCKRNDLLPTIFPFPVIVAALVVWSRGRPGRLAGALLVPQLLFSAGWRTALRRRSLGPLLDCYVKLVEEANMNLGFAIGLYRSRVRRA
jgi:glycosyltransferase involved in cell wall biosynthesis